MLTHDGHDTAMHITTQGANIATVLLHAGPRVSRSGLEKALGVSLDLYRGTLDEMANLGYVDVYKPIGMRGDKVYALTADGAKYARPTFTLDTAAARHWLFGCDPTAGLEHDIDEDWAAEGDLSDTVTRDLTWFLVDVADADPCELNPTAGGDSGPLVSQAGYRVSVQPIAGTETDPHRYVTIVETPDRGSLVGPVHELRHLVCFDVGGDPLQDDGIERLLIASARVVSEANGLVRKSLGLG